MGHGAILLLLHNWVSCEVQQAQDNLAYLVFIEKLKSIISQMFK